MVTSAYYGHSRICTGWQLSGKSTSKFSFQQTRFFINENRRTRSREPRHIIRSSYPFSRTTSHNPIVVQHSTSDDSFMNNYDRRWRLPLLCIVDIQHFIWHSGCAFSTDIIYLKADKKFVLLAAFWLTVFWLVILQLNLRFMLLHDINYVIILGSGGNADTLWLSLATLQACIYIHCLHGSKTWVQREAMKPECCRWWWQLWSSVSLPPPHQSWQQGGADRTADGSDVASKHVISTNFVW